MFKEIYLKTCLKPSFLKRSLQKIPSCGVPELSSRPREDFSCRFRIRTRNDQFFEPETKKKTRNQIAAISLKIQFLVGQVMKIQKKDLNQNMIYGPFKVHLSGQIKKLIKIKIIRKRIQKL